MIAAKFYVFPKQIAASESQEEKKSVLSRLLQLSLLCSWANRFFL
jgi:hypothetical protein